MRRGIILPLSVFFVFGITMTRLCKGNAARTNEGSWEPQADKRGYAEIGESVGNGQWEIKATGKDARLRADVYFVPGSGLRLLGHLQAEPPSGYLLCVYSVVRNLQDRTAAFEMDDFSLGEGDFSSKPSAYIDWRGQGGARIWMAPHSAEFSMSAGEKGDFSFLFPSETGHPHLFLQFRDLKPIKIGDLGDPRAVEPWISKLQDPNVVVRRKAASTLRDLQDAHALEPLTGALDDKEASVRALVAEALGAIGSDETVEPLIDCLVDPSTAVQQNAAAALGELGDTRAVKPLIQLLAGARSVSEGPLRRDVIIALGKIAHPFAVEPLIQVLKEDKIEGNRRAAAEALGALGDVRAVEPLIHALKTDKGNVGLGAATALGRIKDTRAVAPLLDALRAEEGAFAYIPAKALGEIGDKRAMEPLIAALIRKDKYSNLRIAAAEALDKIDPQWRTSGVAKKAASGCIAALEDEKPDIREAAARELQLLRDRRAVEPLIQRLMDESSDVRQAAAWALGALGAPQTLKPLIACLKDQDWEVRRAAATSLGKLKATEAVDSLESVCQTDENVNVRRAAEEAIKTVKGDPDG